jgi:hypothetical protein
MKQKYILFILFAFISFNGISQSNYAVTAIPFQPFSGTLASMPTEDDRYSDVITLPFIFDFYGFNYNQIVVSTNGYLTFGQASLAGQYSPWAITYQIPWTNFPAKNSIFGCYEDLNNNASQGGLGTITYGSYGTAPYRKFVVYFYNQPHFNCNSTIPLTSFQMIINETTNIIDVQLINRAPCTTWQSGNGVIGIINIDGTQGITPPGRNTGAWTATQEAWRFYRPGYYLNYPFTRCDDDTDGFQTFDLTVAANDLSPNNPSAISFFADVTLTLPIANPTAYINNSNPQTIYASGNGMVKSVILNVIDCAIDADNDSVPSETEDANNDTNLANDDTDFDGLPNYLDNDDDGDLVLTSVEYVFARANNISVNVILDTDSDGILNYLDNDDDGDNLLTFLEDYNHDGNPGNDDTNSNGMPDYLESVVALGIDTISLTNNSIKLFPNPTSNVLNIQNNTEDTNASIEIYSVNGVKVKSFKATESVTTISVSELQTGVYFVKVTMNNQVGNYKFIKN